MTKKKTSILVTLLVVIVAIIIWASKSILWLGDDFYYQFIYEPHLSPSMNPDAKPIESFGDIIYSQYNHYFCYNGRIVAHILVQLFCGILGVNWFAILNGLAYVALITSLVFLINKSFSNFGSWISVILLVFLSMITKMTPSCQIGYIWIALANIVFLVYFFHVEYTKISLLRLIPLCILSFIAGNGNEAYSIGMSVGIIVNWFCNIRNYDLKRYSMAISYGIGALLICLSPASRARATGESHDLFQSLFFFVYSLRTVYILIFIVLYKAVVKGASIKTMYLQRQFYWNVMFACIVFNLIIGVMSSRQLFGAEIMAIILILDLLPNKRVNNIWGILLGCVTIVNVWINVERVYLFHKQTQRIFEKYETSLDGRVYQDTWHTGLTEFWTPYFWENGFHTKSFIRLMNRQYANRSDINILPEYLIGKDSLKLDNEIYQFKYKPGKLLLIQSKENPGRFMVERKFFGLIPYQVREIDFSTPVYETEFWRAVIYDELNPVILNTNCETVNDTL